MGILSWIVFGLIVGLLARAVMPGRQSMSLPMTLLLGVGGSLLGGFVASMLTGHPVDNFHVVGLIGSVLGSLLLMFLAGGAMTRRRIV